MLDALFSPRFSMKQCSNDCNQMLGGKHVREENRLPHIVKYSENLVVSRLSFARCRYVQVIVGCILLVVGRFRSFLAGCRSFQVVSCSLKVVSGRFRLFLVLGSTSNRAVLTENVHRVCNNMIFFFNGKHCVFDT